MTAEKPCAITTVGTAPRRVVGPVEPAPQRHALGVELDVGPHRDSPFVRGRSARPSSHSAPVTVTPPAGRAGSRVTAASSQRLARDAGAPGSRRGRAPQPGPDPRTPQSSHRRPFAPFVATTRPRARRSAPAARGMCSRSAPRRRSPTPEPPSRRGRVCRLTVSSGGVGRCLERADRGDQRRGGRLLGGFRPRRQRGRTAADGVTGRSSSTSSTSTIAWRWPPGCGPSTPARRRSFRGTGGAAPCPGSRGNQTKRSSRSRSRNWADDLHADRFLRVGEGAVGQDDQHVPLGRPQRVLTQLDHRAASRRHVRLPVNSETERTEFTRHFVQGC